MVYRRKSHKKSKSRKPCPPGKVRDAVTHRCRADKRSARRKSRKASKARKSPKARKDSKSRRKSRKASKARKSPKARKSSRKESLKCEDLSVLGRTESIRKKYRNRPGPPYPAAACAAEGVLIEVGNDGNSWEIKKSGKSHRWVKMN